MTKKKKHYIKASHEYQIEKSNILAHLILIEYSKTNKAAQKRETKNIN